MTIIHKGRKENEHNGGNCRINGKNHLMTKRTKHRYKDNIEQGSYIEQLEM